MDTTGNNNNNNVPSPEPRTCPCKKLPLCLSSFTAAEYGDLHSLAKRAAASNNASSIANVKDEASGYTPLHLAAQHGHVAATSLLLQMGCQVDAVMLHRAAFSGAVATLRLLLEAVQKEQQQQQQQDDENNDDSGSQRRLLPFHRLLLTKDETFGDLKTPLHKAAAGGRYLAVQLLLDTLREQKLLQEALQIKDASQQTPLDVAMELFKIQEEERQSVARWDQVAGGVADWSNCVQLLKRAAADAEQKDDTDATSMSEAGERSTRVQTTMEIPKHLTTTTRTNNYIRNDGCFDCTTTDGRCLTASWQAAFQAALGNSVATTLSQGDDQQQEKPTTTATATFSVKESLLSPPSAPNPLVAAAATTQSSPATNNNIIGSVTKGILCSECGKPSIALYPAKWGRLICKRCKRINQ